MQRSRLKNIANKSKEMMKPVVGEFEQFKNSLPIEIDDNYRLEAAWKAYGKPKNYQEALWEGLVQPLDDKTFKMPSIGYNEETEEYEYLNKGKENETVNRDIRVWDNDVIPFVKELKQGGYIRIYNDEKDCWTYKKGGKIKVQMADGSGTIEIDYPDKDQKAGRKPVGEKNGKKLYLNGEGKAGYADPQEGPEQTRWMKEGGQMNVIPEGALHARKNNMELAEEGEVTHKGIPVVDNDGEQQAEVEKEEWTMSKELTEDVERWYKKYFNDDTPKMEREELAIKCGKRIVEELLHNTDDRAGLIQKMEEEL